MTRLHTDVARVERQQRSSRALLNALMDRPSDAPLGPPEDLSVTPTTDITGLASSIDTNRPEVVAAGRGVRRSEALLDGARHAARFPNVMVGLDYWYMPMFPDFQHAYGAMVAINLPWLSGRRRDEEREAEQTVQAERHALESTKNTVRYELRDAAARVDSARQSFTIIDQDLLAQAKRSLEATQAAYAAGQGDAVGAAGRAPDLLAGADRACAGADGAGVQPGRSRTRRGDAGGGRREAMSTPKSVDDTGADGPPPAEGPPEA